MKDLKRYQECIRDKLLTGQCFYKFYSDTGFEGRRLEEAANLEKGPTFFTNGEDGAEEKSD